MSRKLPKFACEKNFAEMKKQVIEFSVDQNQHFSPVYSLLKLSPISGAPLGDICPGQFVQVETPANATFLRRPISVCFVDKASNQLWLLVRNAGSGSKAIIDSAVGSTLNIIYPLGNGFTTADLPRRPILIGGGVGVAPLLYLAKRLADEGVRPAILLGARRAADVLLRQEFEEYGDVFVSTEDGSVGEKGLVTQHSILQQSFDRMYCCGPMPMMKAIAAIARKNAIDCEVSLENVMGCGIGACLCCVEKTVKGNVCVCSDGPVFNLNELLW